MAKPTRELESRALKLSPRERARLAQRLTVRSVEFHPEAQDEFISAAQLYERQANGLGLDAYVRMK